MNSAENNSVRKQFSFWKVMDYVRLECLCHVIVAHVNEVAAKNSHLRTCELFPKFLLNRKAGAVTKPRCLSLVNMCSNKASFSQKKITNKSLIMCLWLQCWPPWALYSWLQTSEHDRVKKLSTSRLFLFRYGLFNCSFCRLYEILIPLWYEVYKLFVCRSSSGSSPPTNVAVHWIDQRSGGSDLIS